MAFIAQTDEDNGAAQNVATNLFQQTTGGGGQPVQNGAMSPTGQGGDQSQAIGGGPQNATQKAPTISNSGSSSKEVIRRNEGKAQSPYDLGEISGNIKNAKTSLQDEANNYVTTAQKTDYSAPSDQINKALTGDADAYSALGQRLTQAKPAQAAFAPTTNTDYSPKVNQLQDSSLRNYFKNSGGPMATAGDAAFDTMLLNKNKDFKQQRNTVKNEAAGLDTEAKAIKDKAATDAGVGYDQAYDTGTQKIKTDIGNAVNPIRDQAVKQAQAGEAERQKYAGMSAQDQIKNTPGYADWLRGIVGQVGGDAGQQAYLNEAVNGGLGQGQVDTNEMSLAGRVGINPAFDFIDTSQAPVTANNYLNADQARQLNSGYNLLGQRGDTYAAGGAAASPYSFNSGAAKAYLSSLIGKKSDSDAAQKSQQDAFDKNAAAVNAERAAINQGKVEADEREEARNKKTNQDTAIDAAGGGIARNSKDEYDKATGKIICAEYAKIGWLPKEILAADLAYQAKYASIETVKNYLTWAVYVVPLVRDSRFIRALYWPITKNWAYQMAYRMGVVEKPPFAGALIEKTLRSVSNLIGSTIRKSRREALLWSRH